MELKTVEVKVGFEGLFQIFLDEKRLKNEPYTLSDGVTKWEIEIPNEESLEKIKQLDYVKNIRKTRIYYPS